MKRAQSSITILGSLLIWFQLTQIVYGQNRFAKTPDQITKLKKLIAAVESNPNNRKAHEDYISGMNINDPKLAEQYAIWMKRFPKSAIVPFALGKTYEEYDNQQCKEYLLKALELNPGLAEAWEYLSLNATMLGDNSGAIKYMQKATQCDPQNADFAFKYAYLNKDGGPAKYDSLMLNVAYHFSDSEKGAYALFCLASIPFNASEKTAYYEMLFQLYSKQDTHVFRAGMADYFVYLLTTSPDKAFGLALRMVLQEKINRGDWKKRIIVARYFVEARRLMDENKPTEAIEMLKHIDLGNSLIGGILIDAEETLALIKAEASDASNKTREAYDSIAMYYSKQPSDRLRKALFNYAFKLGIDSNKVDSDIWKTRDSLAWKPTDFTLENYADHRPVSLSNYRGKVVLLTYWFPGCGPCRNEFPYFEAILKKINSKNVAYLAINLSPQEDCYVLPIVKNSGYTFVPLRDEPNEAKGNLPNVQGAPANFLLDQSGRVIFSDFQITDKNERTLELMISELLKMGNVEKNHRK